MVTLSAPKGLGDAILLRCVVLHYLPKPVKVYTMWPEVFTGLDVNCRPREEVMLEDHDKLLAANYPLHLEGDRDKNFWQLACMNSGLPPSEMDMKWEVTNGHIRNELREKAQGKPILVYQPPKLVKNSLHAMLYPRLSAFNKVLEEKTDHFRIRIGHPRFVQKGGLFDLDRFGEIPIPETFDICEAADVLYGAYSFINMIAEGMNKKYISMFTRRAAKSSNPRFNQAIPDRLFLRKENATAVWDET